LNPILFLIRDLDPHIQGKRFIARDVGDVNQRAWIDDEELDMSGEPNYVELVGSRGLDTPRLRKL
jgi:hypothetical protein